MGWCFARSDTISSTWTKWLVLGHTFRRGDLSEVRESDGIADHLVDLRVVRIFDVRLGSDAEHLAVADVDEHVLTLLVEWHGYLMSQR